MVSTRSMLRDRNRRTASFPESISSVTNKRRTQESVPKIPIRTKRAHDLRSQSRQPHAAQATALSNFVQELLHADELCIAPSDLSATAEINLVRLFSQKSPNPGFSTELYGEESLNEHESRIGVKLAVCRALSGFPAGSWQRGDSFSLVVYEICECLRVIIKDRQFCITLFDGFVQNIREQLYMISDSPDFNDMTCDELYRLYAAIFFSEGDLTLCNGPDCIPHIIWPSTREAASKHLLKAYPYGREILELDWSRGVAALLVTCLGFNYELRGV